MNNQIKVFLTAISMSFLMVACGGGGGSSTPEADTPQEVDNSQLADGENQYGYFGENVIFADTNITSDSYTGISNTPDGIMDIIITKVWTIHGDGLYLHSIFHADGDGYVAGPNDENLLRDGAASFDKYIDYGVSKDGTVMRIGGDYNATITLIRVIDNCIPAAPSIPGEPCYLIDFEDVNGKQPLTMYSSYERVL